MARHSTGAKNNKVAGSFIATILAILVVIALVVWWILSTRGGDDQAQGPECIDGDMTLKVAATSQELADPAIATYNNSNSVVRDHCVTAEYTDDIAEAAVYITAASDGTANAFLSGFDRSAATLEWPVIDVRNVGAATKENVGNFDEITDLTYASKGNSLATALVAAGKDPENQDALKEILRDSRSVSVSDAVADNAQAIAVSELNVPEGYSFVPLQVDGANVTLPVRAVALNPTDSVSEDQTRAGADFGAVAAVEGENPFASLTGIAAAEALANVEGTSQPDDSNEEAPGNTETSAPESSAAPAPEEDSAQAASSKPMSTLYLLDTSDFMGQTQNDLSWFRASANAIAEAAPKVGQAGSVALWNYSSPLNPGVAQGWRTNVGLDDTTGGQTAAAVVQGFGTAGQPQTMSAVSAALKQAAAVSTPENPVRVVLIASGSTDNWDIAPAVQEAKSKGVVFDLVHVGEQDLNPSLASAVDDLGGTTHNATSINDVAPAINKASGL